MKTFKALVIGDVILKAVVRANSPSEEIITVITVKAIEHSEKGNLLINATYNAYNRDWRYDLLIPYDKCDVTHISGLTNHPGFWFTDKDLANEYVRRLVLSTIKAHENAIVKAKKDHLYTIELYREKYHELLNPSYHSEFSIVDFSNQEQEVSNGQ